MQVEVDPRHREGIAGECCIPALVDLNTMVAVIVGVKDKRKFNEQAAPPVVLDKIVDKFPPPHVIGEVNMIVLSDYTSSYKPYE